MNRCGGRNGGRGGGHGGGRGNIVMTQAELTDLINTHVAEALAAQQVGMICTDRSSLLNHILDSHSCVVFSFQVNLGTRTRTIRLLARLKHSWIISLRCLVGLKEQGGYSVGSRRPSQFLLCVTIQLGTW
ncbi:hypothetical protein HanRHA438_Chr05g0232291 [Helianthus annuus]|nr:hypothetical protein HanRHA438_Chr05g0232291 [Helianthus annuus]